MRIFIAVNLPDRIKDRMAAEQERLKRTPLDVAWAGREKLHLTLKFLGEVPEERIEQVASALTKAVSGTPPFEVSFRGLGAFPSKTRPRVIWAGVVAGAEELAAAAGRVDAALEPLGFTREKRPFAGHVTFGRVRSPLNRELLSKKICAGEAIEFGTFTVTGIDIMRSVLNPHGARYTCLRSISV